MRQIEAAGGVAVADECDVSQDEQVAARSPPRSSNFGRLDIVFNNVGIPTPRLGMIFEDHTVDDFDRLVAVNLRGVFLGCKHAVIQFKQQGDGGVILNTGSVAGLVGWGGTVYGATKGGVHQLTRAVAIECAPFDIRVNAICPAGMPYTNFAAAGGMEASERAASSRWRSTSAPCIRSGGRSPPRTAPRPRCTSCPTPPRTSPACSSRRRRVRRPMSATGDAQTARPRGAAAALRPAQQLQRALRWRLHRRSVPGLARAARAGARPRGHRARAHRASRATRCSRGCRSRTDRTSRRSASRRATPPSATTRCSPRRPTPPVPAATASRS